MLRNRGHKNIWLFVAALLLIDSSLLKGARCGQPREEKITTNWIGQCGDESCVLRLSLERSGKGVIGILFNDETFEIYRIARWTLGVGGYWLGVTLDPCGHEDARLPALYAEFICGFYGALKRVGWRREFYLTIEQEKEIPHYPDRWRALRRKMLEAAMEGLPCTSKEPVREPAEESVPRENEKASRKAEDASRPAEMSTAGGCLLRVEEPFEVDVSPP
jgi:hypothetical protein